MRVCAEPLSNRAGGRSGLRIEAITSGCTPRASCFPSYRWASSARWQSFAAALTFGTHGSGQGRAGTEGVPEWAEDAEGAPAGEFSLPLRLAVRSARAKTAEVDPLYLFLRGVQWRKHADTTAGWELVEALGAEGVTAQVAAAQLSRARNMHLPLGSWIRPDIAAEASVQDYVPTAGPQRVNKAVMMNTPYGLEIIESCNTCRLRKDKWFCSLSPEALRSFSSVSHLCTYPDGAVLFVEGQSPRGAFVLCSGRVKLSTTSREGKVLILKMAQPGEALGLSAVVSGTPYELRAETLGPCQVNFIEREALMKLLEKHVEVGLHTAQALSKEFQSAYRDIHELVLARSSAGKLARLLLSWSSGPERPAESREIRIRSSLTHEEMAQMIGSSRETVTRLLSELKKKELIRLEGSTLVIRNRTALEALAA